MKFPGKPRHHLHSRQSLHPSPPAGGGGSDRPRLPTYGFEIKFSGSTQNLTDKLTADDHITITDDGYKIRTLIDRMGRKDRQAFIRFFNAGCIGFGASPRLSHYGNGRSRTRR